MLAQTAFHRVFQLLSQMAHIRFRSRKRVHTRLCSKDRTQRITGRNRGCFRWGAITTLGAFRTFTNIPGPGIRTTYFAAFRSWSEALLKDTESLRNVHLEKSAVTGVRHPSRSPMTAKVPLKVHLRLRFQNLGKPRTAGLCGRAAGACDCGPLSCAKIERPSPSKNPA